MTAPGATSAWVAALAPHVDRLALCVHKPASQRPELRAAVDAFGESFVRPTIAVVAAPLIAAGR